MMDFGRRLTREIKEKISNEETREIMEVINNIIEAIEEIRLRLFDE